ncbi:MAG: DUF882 domain-containing protein [Hyphomicrobiaceae bacterium]|nr:MAG: DUF882 domain-containing protein [Hyphomicrobiaceae bacterium]
MGHAARPVFAAPRNSRAKSCACSLPTHEGATMARSVDLVSVVRLARRRSARVRAAHVAMLAGIASLCGSPSALSAESLLRPTLRLQIDGSDTAPRPPATHELRIPTVRDAGGQQVVPQAVIRRLTPNARWTTEAFPAPRTQQPGPKPVAEPVKRQQAVVASPEAVPPRARERAKPIAAILPPRKPLLQPVTRTVVPTSHTPVSAPAPAPLSVPPVITKPVELNPRPVPTTPAPVHIVRLQPLAKPPAHSILAEPEPLPKPKPQLVAAFSPAFVPVKTDALVGNEPAPAEAQCLPASLKKVLAEATRRFGTIWVTSAHRSVERNRLVGGRPRSFHLECRAVDFRPERNPLGLMAFLRGRPEVGGLKRYPNGFFHIDDGPRRTW